MANSTSNIHTITHLTATSCLLTMSGTCFVLACTMPSDLGTYLAISIMSALVLMGVHWPRA